MENSNSEKTVTPSHKAQEQTINTEEIIKKYPKIRIVFLEAIKQSPEIRVSFLKMLVEQSKIAQEEVEKNNLIERLRKEPDLVRILVEEYEFFGRTTFFESLKPLEKEVLKIFNKESRYQWLKNLGEGGMGVVGLVEDSMLNRKVALKKIKPASKDSTTSDEKEKANLQRLHQEAQTIAFLEHPNIVPLYDMQQLPNGEIYFTMRKVEGETLRSILEKNKEDHSKYNKNKLLSIYLKICDAVAYAHAQGVIHRDLKPENIMVGEFGEVYVMDWGIAEKIGQETGRAGTFGYIAPELKEGSTNVTTVMDIYALGQILKECYTSLSPTEELKQQLESQKGLFTKATQLKKKIPKDLKAVIAKAKADKPEERYQNVQKLIEDLENYQNNHKVSAKKYSHWETFKKWRERNKQNLFIVKTVIFTFVVSAYVLNAYLKNEAEKNRIKRNKLKTQHFFNESKSSINNAKNIQNIQNRLNLEKKIGFLLKAFNLIEDALQVTSDDIEILQAMRSVGGELVELTCLSGDYRLALHIANEMQRLPLSILSEKKKKSLLSDVEHEKTKQLKKNMASIKKWDAKARKDGFRGLSEGEAEDFKNEISSMPEKEVFEYILKIFHEGLTYFEKRPSKSRNIKKREYYFHITEITGRLRHPKSSVELFNALKIMQQKFISSKEHLKEGDIKFMIALTESLAKSDPPPGSYSSEIYEIRMKHKPTSLFRGATERAYRKLLSLDINHLYNFRLKINSEEIEQLNEGKFPGALKEKVYKNFEESLSLKLEEIDLTPLEKKDFKNWEFVDKNNQKLKYLVEIEKNYLNVFDAEGYRKRGHGHLDLAKVGEYLDKENLLKSIECSRKATILDLELHRAYNNLGIAKKSLAALQKRNGKEFETLFKEAIKDFTKVIKLKPEFYIGYLNRGITRGLVGELSEAIDDLNLAKELNPHSAAIYLALAEVKRATRDLKGALKASNDAIRVLPKSYKAYANRGEVHKEMENLDEAIKDFTEAIRLNPKAAKVFNNRGTVKRMKGDPEEAIKDYTEAIRLDPWFLEAYANRGAMKSRLGNYEGAIADFNEALEKNPRMIPVYKNRGLTKMSMKVPDLEGAIQDFTKAIELEPESYLSYYNRSLAKIKLEEQTKGKNKNYDEAIKDLNQAIHLEDRYFKAYVQRGFIYYKKNNFQEALKDFNKALKLKSTYTKFLLPQQEVTKAKDIIFLTHIKEDYPDELALNSDFATAYLRCGNVYVKSGKFEKGLENFDKAIHLNPSSFGIYIGWGNRYMHGKAVKKDLGKAIVCFVKLLDLKIESEVRKEIENSLAECLLNRAKILRHEKDFKGMKEELLLFQKYIRKEHPKYEGVKKSVIEVEKILKKKNKKNN